MPHFDHAFDWARRGCTRGRCRPPCSASRRPRASSRSTRSGSNGGRATSVDDALPAVLDDEADRRARGAAAHRAGASHARDAARRAMPEFGAGRDDVVRLRHLVSHTSGIVEPPMDTPAGLRPSLLAPGARLRRRHGVAVLDDRVRRHRRAHRAGDAARHGSAPSPRSASARMPRASRSTRRPSAARARRCGRAGTRLRALRRGCGIRVQGSSGRASDLLAIGSALLRTVAAARRAGHVRRDAAAAHRRAAEARAVRRESRGQDWGFTWNLRHSAPGLLATRHVRSRRLGGARVLDHAVARRVLRPAHEPRRRLRPVRRGRRRAAQRGRRRRLIGSVAPPCQAEEDSG